jgi:molybdate transport system regulatory protein
MNRCWAEPLVEASARGGARLTATGRTVLAAYRALEAELAAAARSPALDRLEALMAPRI